MRVRRSLLALLASAAALAAAAATDVQQQQRSLFQRAAQVIQGAFLGGQQTTAVTAAAEGEQLPKLEDPWETQPGLKMVRRLLDGDQLGVVLDMARNPELEQIWGNPAAAFRMLQNYPMLGGIRGVKDVMAKSEAEVTPEDVRRCDRVAHTRRRTGPPLTSFPRLHPPIPTHTRTHTGPLRPPRPPARGDHLRAALGRDGGPGQGGRALRALRGQAAVRPGLHGPPGAH